VRRDDLDLARIIGYALRLDAATGKRLGWVLESQGITDSRLVGLERRPIKGYRKLDPTGPRGICVNLSISEGAFSSLISLIASDLR